MRITNSMMVSQFLTNANSSLNRVNKYQNQVDSTKRITQIQDDPLATISTLRARNKLSNLTVYQSNITTASSYLTEAESSVGELNEIIKTAYYQVVSAASGSKTQDELNIIAEELENLKSEIVSIGNSSIGVNYIFGGYNFTGSTDNTTKTPPFSTNEQGALLYNGINVSQFAWKEEYENSKTLITDYADNITKIAAELEAGTSEYYAKEFVAANAVKELSNIVSAGKTALSAAHEFGIKTDFEDVSKFLDDVKDIINRLDAERSKDLAEDDATNDNSFDIDQLKTILADAKTLLTDKFDAGGNPVGLEALNAMGDQFAIDKSVEDAFNAEKLKRAELQIGTSQTVEYTLNGVDLMGSGKDNIYHVIDKSIKMLRGEIDSSGLNTMITALQTKQSATLNQMTKIGSTQNRLELIKSRYDSSEINYTQMRSEAEDADMAEAIMNFTTAKTVYSAALAAGAEILQISLVDFLR